MSYTLTEALADIAVAVGAPISVLQLIRMHRQRQQELKRAKCAATMKDWAKIEGEIRTLVKTIPKAFVPEWNARRENVGISKDPTTQMHDFILENDMLHEDIKKYLSNMEQFSVGIHFRRYDIKVFDRLYGQTTIKMHDILTPYLTYVAGTEGEFFYGDFENLVRQLTKIRAKREKQAAHKKAWAKIVQRIGCVFSSSDKKEDASPQ